VVPFGPIVANTLKEWKLACPKGDLNLVFPTGKGNIEALPNILTRGFIPTVVKALGSPKYTGLHCLRHFYASWCIDRGLQAKVIQERLGHSTITETFDAYGHLFPRADDGKEIAEAELKLMNAT
jgi:integrase